MTRPRSAGGAPRPHDEPSTAARAAWTARSTSAFVAFATTASRSPVEGLTTSKVPPSDEGTRWPLMMRGSGIGSWYVAGGLQPAASAGLKPCGYVRSLSSNHLHHLAVVGPIDVDF